MPPKPPVYQLSPNSKIVLVIFRMDPPIYLTDHKNKGYERAIDEELKESLSIEVYHEILVQHQQLNLVKTEFIQNITSKLDTWTLQTLCTAKGRRWADILPGVSEFWSNYNSKSRFEKLNLLKAVRRLGNNLYD